MPGLMSDMPHWRRCTWIVIVAVALGACATSRGFNSGDAGLTPEQRALRTEAERFNQTMGEGAVVGALLGAGIGALAGRRNPLAGALVGAAAGAALGAGAGYLVAAQNEQYASSEQRLNAQIGAARQDVARYQTAAINAQRVADMHRANIARMNAEYRAGRISAEQYRNRAAGIRSDLGAMSALIQENEQLVQAYEQEIANLQRQGANTSQMVTARNDLLRQRQALQAQYDSLLSAVDQAPVPAA